MTLVDKILDEFKEFESEEDIFGQDKRFEQVISKIISRIDSKPKTQQLEYYRQLMDKLLSSVVSTPINNRRLTVAARDFWRYAFNAGHPKIEKLKK